MIFRPLLILFFFSCSCSFKTIQEQSPSEAKAISHEIWDGLLRLYVSNEGLLDYHGILEDDDLETYLELLSSAHPDLSWSREERLSYWINAYNAFTVKLILDNYPVESIKDISGPWTKEFIVIEGIPYSLGDIEHKVLRKLYNEPRIHYAISCASISCPDLPNEAIMADILEGQLDRMAERFINDPSKNLIEKDEVKLSKIYKWFKSDFTVSSSLKDHLKKYSTVEIDKATKIEYLEYNWKLNDIASKEH